MATDSARPVLVLTALEVEYQAVRAHLSALRKDPHPEGTIFETGRLRVGGGAVTIGVTGEGNHVAAVLAERGIRMFEPQALVFVGVAGGLKDDIDLGDIVVGTKIYGYHGGKEDDHGFHARPSVWWASHGLEHLARDIARTGSWTGYLAPYPARDPPRVHFKPIAAGEIVLNSRTTPLAEQLRGTYNDAAAIEMESAGVAQAGHLNRSLPSLTIRAISDKADGAKHADDAEGWQATAAAHAAAFAVALAAGLTAGSDRELPVRDTKPRQRHGEATQNITAHSGGIAYGVLDGNMYLDQSATPARTPDPWSGPADSGSPSAADPPRVPGVAWRALSARASVAWRTDLITTGTGGRELPALEIHLAVVGDRERLEARRLGPLADQLALAGRARKLFTATEPLNADSSDQAAWAISTDHSSPSGIAVYRTGQRSAWQPLPRDSLGAVLDPVDIAERLTRMLALLVAIDVPVPAQVAPATGIEQVAMLTEGRVNEMPRQRASVSHRQAKYIRVLPEDSLSYQDLIRHSPDVADELTARLLAEFRRLANR